MSSSRSERQIVGPGSCVRTLPGWPIPGPSFPQMPPADDDAGQAGYVFPTWRAALADSHARIADAYEKRRGMFKAAHDAGLSYRDIGEATGLSAAAVGKVLGRQGRASLDSPVDGGAERSIGVDFVAHKAAPRRANVRGHGHREDDSQ